MMTRIIMAAVLAVLVAVSATAMAQQGSRASRWQPDQFGPIVPTDTMWSIATYYGRQRGVSLFEMMDAIVAANPRAFRDNRPDFMYTGFYLDIPALGEQTAGETTPKASLPADKTADTAATDSTSEAAAEQAASTAPTRTAAADETPVTGAEVEGQIAISVSEMQALRGQLSESIDLIENLQSENTDLQQRLEAVTRELRVLRQRAADEQRASAEMESIAQELNAEGTQELTAEGVAQQPSEVNPGMAAEEAEMTAAQPTDAEVPGYTEQVTEVTESAAEADQTAVDTSTAERPVATQSEPQPVATRSSKQQQSWMDWLLKPLHLGGLALLLILLLGGLWYFAYVRRLEREIGTEPAPETDAAVPPAVSSTSEPAAESATTDDRAATPDTIEETELAAAAETTTRPASEATEVTEATDEPAEDVSGKVSDEVSERTDKTSSEWQEEALEPFTSDDDDVEDVEVSDVDLDAYLREHADDEPAPDTSADDEDVDPISKQVDELLAFEPSSPEDDETAVPLEPEDVSEYRVVEQTDTDTADSFGGLRLDDDMTTSAAPEQKPAADSDTETPVTKNKKTDTADADDDYLSIDALMEEADTEASEEQVDPYDKDKINDALAGDHDGDHDYDLSTEAMLDESKSPAARLDLAQVYIDMGEVDDARDLLEGIQGCGDEEAEQEATALLKKLSEQGGR
ncbi:tetratricopeptide repeat protein [Pseudidiomarina sp. 1APP75-32.1]|uniref:Tetratricopeptide repeat protein n=1 Tax=Pseudidiomarina terrestris TaxID=2820060 RepID=A0AAW7R182_9GAMM|nr:tetratricopeptide repeat protein [Pseudidiomarina sp. 1APP75-32.1]MDN7129012.1 tetratricopeptide repeat protein [Pseudidiomarina sp. 1APR75-15]